jgi:hypothetical protein
MSVAFQVRFAVSPAGAGCGAAKSWANAEPEYREPMSKKKRVKKRIMNMRIILKMSGAQWLEGWGCP